MDSVHRYQVAKRTSFVNATINTLLAAFKIVIGWLGNSSALIADGVHSLSDLISDSLVLIASKAGTKSPDPGHPYGHQRIETIAAIAIAILFVGAGVYIFYDAVLHFLAKKIMHQPDIYVLIVAAVSVVANEWLFRYTLKMGKLINSNLVITNAWHNRSDVYVSLLVLFSVSLAFFGIPHVDAIGAAIVALLIVKIGFKMIWESLNELLDAAVDEKTLLQIHGIIEHTPGVKAVHQLRTRLHGGSIFVDVHIQLVNPKISVSEGHHISDQVGLRLANQIKKISDITVHIDPEDDEEVMTSVNLPNRVELRMQLENCWKELPGYDALESMRIHYLDGKLEIEIILPLALTEKFSAQELQQRYKTACESINDIDSIHVYFSQR